MSSVFAAKVFALTAALGSATGAGPGSAGFSPQPWSTVDPATFIRPVPRGKFAPAKENWLDPLQTPKPTSEWWENMVLTKSDIDGNGNGFVIPYIIDPKPYGVKLAVPFPLAVSSDIYENGFDTIVLVTNLGAAEDFPGGYHAARHDKLTVDLVWGEPGAGMKCVLVRGSPYITCDYDQISPSFNAPQMLDRYTIDRQARPCDGSNHTGTRFELSFIQSDETWVLYLEKPLTVTCRNNAARMSLDAIEPYTGTLRAAMANNCTTGRSAFHCKKRPPADPEEPVFMELLDKHAHVFASSAIVQFSADEAAGTGAVHYAWTKRHFAGTNASTPLLMVQMAHHWLAGVEGSTLAYPTPFSVSLHGPSWLATGDEWRVQYKLPTVMWHAPREVDPKRKKEIIEQLELDKDWLPPLNYQLGAGDPYNAGKMLSRMARVALVAEHVGRVDISLHVLKKLKPLSELYFSGKAANYFLYDHSWGGLISCGCLYDDCGGKCEPHCNKNGDEDFCPCFTDPGMDFGNGFYNDHHFHWGYHLYALAVIAHFDRAWVESHREAILLFARDFANPSTDDRFFPAWRNKDWYMGFSWASGIALAAGQPFRNGRNQESTSESINAYYALQLLGEALDHKEMRIVGQLATASEIHSAQVYWHLDDANIVYPDILKEKRMLGILWQNLAQYQTWFGGQAYMVHGIQMIPITPISELTADRNFTAVEYPVFAESCGGGGQCLTDGWITFTVMAHAIVDPDTAWEEAKKLPDAVFAGTSPAGNGNSRSNTLYWIATRGQGAEEAGGKEGISGGTKLMGSGGVLPKLAHAASDAVASAGGAAYALAAAAAVLALGAALTAVLRWDGARDGRLARAAATARGARDSLLGRRRADESGGDRSNDALLQSAQPGEEFHCEPSRVDREAS